MTVDIIASSTAGTEIPPWLIAPFALLLLLIAVMPLSPHAIKSFWEKRYMFVSIGLGLLVAAYYLLQIPGGGMTTVHTLKDYFSFICLIGSLFVVAGGIHINIRGKGSPFENVVFLAIGAVLANVIGTTGASMVMIRPWVRMNRARISPYHIVFFIFVVSNVGGALTPIGDPPLFLGYMKGVPFFWLIEHVSLQWILTVAAILAVFFAFDLRSFKKMPGAFQDGAKQADTWRFDGAINVLFLLIIVGSVLLVNEAYFPLREVIMLGAAVASYLLTPKAVHSANAFTFGPIKEVAFLFVGIFMTMMPALGYLEIHGRQFGFTHALQYYFTSGALSSVLDNAPTYLTFLEVAKSSAGNLDVPALLATHPHYVIGVSLGAVFFGAMTYIGNGPNFMVKSIAESEGVATPTFVGYIVKYSLPILLPILALSGWLFLR